LIGERTRAGMAAAQQCGVKVGRRKAMTEQKISRGRELVRCREGKAVPATYARKTIIERFYCSLHDLVVGLHSCTVQRAQAQMDQYQRRYSDTSGGADHSRVHPRRSPARIAATLQRMKISTVVR
jgi:DNA invertase Pin-like site-specific DNA recombinase